MLIIILGLPGTGKTYFAHKLAEKLSVPHFNTDQVRTELNLRSNYHEAVKQQVYDQLFQKANDAFGEYDTVILDATFSQRHHREKIKQMMEEKGQAVYFIELTADEATIRRRMSHPRKDSEADFSVYHKVKQTFQPLEAPHLTLDSSRQSASEMIRQALSYLSESS